MKGGATFFPGAVANALNYAGAVTASAPLTLESIRVTFDHLKALEAEWQTGFNEWAKGLGFDLEKDGVVIVPQWFDMGLVPPAYRDTKVRKSALAESIYLMRDPLYGIV
jgi:hypothetical protein